MRRRSVNYRLSRRPRCLSPSRSRGRRVPRLTDPKFPPEPRRAYSAGRIVAAEAPEAGLTPRRRSFSVVWARARPLQIMTRADVVPAETQPAAGALRPMARAPAVCAAVSGVGSLTGVLSYAIFEPNWCMLFMLRL